MNVDATDARRKRVLVVEDEGIVAMDLGAMLPRMGYEVVGTSATGEGALSLAAEHNPDLILMDIVLRGEMDGIEAARRITEQIAVPVLYLTAHSDRATLDRATETSPYGYVVKPFAEVDLRVAIEVTMRRFAADVELRDVQARLAQQEQLAALGRLVAAISHEINNPLQGLLGHLYLAKSRVADHPEMEGVQTYLDAVQTEANHIAGIVRRVRDLYAVSGVVDAPSYPCEVLCDVLLVTDARLRAADISVVVADEVRLPGVAIPSDQLTQIFHAVVLNAPRAMPGGGVLTISSQRPVSEPRAIAISFANTGSALTDEMRARIFEPFATPYPTDVHGADLGLPIARQIAEAYGGAIQVAAGDAGGTVFNVVLPLADAV